MLRLVAYWQVDDNDFANARLLDLKETVGEGGDRKVSKVMSALAAETSLKKLVKDLNDLFEKQGIDMTVFKPNQFAALSVYYAQFLTQVTARTKHWLNRRYCCGLRQYVPGNEIEPKEEWDMSSRQYVTVSQQEHLASQCLPKHYDDSGVAQPAGLEQSGQAIASAPVVCSAAWNVRDILQPVLPSIKDAVKEIVPYLEVMPDLLHAASRELAVRDEYTCHLCGVEQPAEDSRGYHATTSPYAEPSQIMRQSSFFLSCAVITSPCLPCLKAQVF